MQNEERIKGLMAAFDIYEDHYKRQELEEAIALQEEITPHLIGVLEELTADPEGYALEEHFANTYAVALLAHFREPTAHLPIIRAFLLGEEDLDDLWGEMVTETLPALLFQTCNGSLEEIRKLVLNRDADAYVRGAAVEALTYAVARGVAERQEIVDFLADLFTGDEAEEGSFFWSDIAATIADLHPEGAMEIIREAYARGLIFPDHVRLREIEVDFTRPQEALLEELRQTVDRRIPKDIHGYLSWFACFQDDGPARRPVKQLSLKVSEKKQKAAQKSKKKVAKKSKRKNRKK